MALFLIAPVYAAYDDEDEGCAYFSPAYALCSVHAHNAGMLKNPEGSQKAVMDEIIALKTTLIAQQMVAQYDALEVMMKKLRSQMNKAVLTDKLNVIAGASGNTSNNDESGSSAAKTKIEDIAQRIEGARDCSWEPLDTKYDCFAEQMRLVAQNAKTNTTDAKKLYTELQQTLSTLMGYDSDGKTQKNMFTECKKLTTGDSSTTLQTTAQKCFNQLQASQAGYKMSQKVVKGS